MSTFAPTLTWEQYQKLPPEQRSRPLTPQEYAQLSQPQLEQGGLADPIEGAPADFSGPIFSNPNHVRPKLDTDPAGEPTRLPNGVSLQKQNFSGQMPADVSNPPRAEILPTGATTTGTPLSLPPGATLVSSSTDAGSDLALPPGATLVHDGAADTHKDEPGFLDREIPLDSHWNASLQGAQSIARSFRDTAKGTWQSLTTAPQDDTEKKIALISPAALPVYRMLRGAGHTVADATQLAGAFHDINQSPDPLGSYAKAAQETAGQGAGQALFALATEGTLRAAPKVLDTVSSPTKITAPVRAVARGVNTALEKAPGEVGASLGASAGGAVAGHVGAEIGGGAGYALGKILPQIKIPGEGFGLPDTVAGGEGGNLPGPPEAPPGAEEEAPIAAAESKPAPTTAQLKKALTPQLDRALGNEPVNIKPGVAMRKQMTTSPAPPVDLPEGFTPIEKSSVLKGYKYDPATQRFEAITSNGSHYVHSEVSPETAQKFEATDSKGSAWTDLKNTPGVTYRGKMMDGEFVPAKPSTMQSVVTGKTIAKARAGMETPRTVEIDPATGRPEFSDVIAAKKSASQPAETETKVPSAETRTAKSETLEDNLQALLEQSLDRARTKNANTFANYDVAIKEAMKEGPAWTPEKASPLVHELNKLPGNEFELRGSVGEGRATDNDLDLWHKSGDLKDARATLEKLGFKFNGKTPHGETYTNGAQHVDLWDQAHEPRAEFGKDKE